VNKALLDTDILSEIIKGIDPTGARNAAAFNEPSTAEHFLKVTSNESRDNLDPVDIAAGAGTEAGAGQGSI
jgi:hypothetical protein